ncbi:RHS repeat-associated core domain-containing protein [Flavobacterium oreochromis]|uniref:RHS repeat-associated core domain-containing protein n=1 Tax=Flavobacterium oreochromis TaxID=2906078 RepID=UPI00385DDBB9
MDCGVYYYNRFRYYDASTGLYLSQDPIGLAGNNPTLYGYVKDSNGMVDILGLAGEDVDWGKYFREISGTEPPAGMERPHAHHIVFKNGHPNQQAILKESKGILEKHDIDWLKGKENLVWAPNKNHSKEAAQKVLDELKEADKKGTRQAIVDALEKMGKKFADGTICH